MYRSQYMRPLHQTLLDEHPREKRTASEKQHSALLELLHRQLESKEQIIRSQQDTIQDLRLQLTAN